MPLHVVMLISLTLSPGARVLCLGCVGSIYISWMRRDACTGTARLLWFPLLPLDVQYDGKRTRRHPSGRSTRAFRAYYSYFSTLCGCADWWWSAMKPAMRQF